MINRMIQLNEHVREEFKKQLKEIRNLNFKEEVTSPIKKIK